MPADAGPPAAPPGGTSVRKGGIAWYLGVALLAVCWLLLLAESVHGGRYDFASTFDRGWVCGQGTLGLLLLMPVALFVLVALLVLAGRSDAGFVACAALALAGCLGALRGSRPDFCVLFFGVAAILLVVPGVLAFGRHRHEADRVRLLATTLAATAVVGAVGHLGWAPDLDAAFRERSTAAVQALESCVNARAVAPSPTAAATVGPAGSPSAAEGLSPALAACTAQERDPNWRGRRFVLRETAGEVAGEVLFHFGDRDYRRSFRFAKSAGLGPAGQPPGGAREAGPAWQPPRRHGWGIRGLCDHPVPGTQACGSLTDGSSAKMWLTRGEAGVGALDPLDIVGCFPAGPIVGSHFVRLFLDVSNADGSVTAAQFARASEAADAAGGPDAAACMLEFARHLTFGAAPSFPGIRDVTIELSIDGAVSPDAGPVDSLDDPR